MTMLTETTRTTTQGTDILDRIHARLPLVANLAESTVVLLTALCMALALNVIF